MYVNYKTYFDFFKCFFIKHTRKRNKARKIVEYVTYSRISLSTQKAWLHILLHSQDCVQDCVQIKMCNIICHHLSWHRAVPWFQPGWCQQHTDVLLVLRAQVGCSVGRATAMRAWCSRGLGHIAGCAGLHAGPQAGHVCPTMYVVLAFSTPGLLVFFIRISFSCGGFSNHLRYTVSFGNFQLACLRGRGPLSLSILFSSKLLNSAFWIYTFFCCYFHLLVSLHFSFFSIQGSQLQSPCPTHSVFSSAFSPHIQFCVIPAVLEGVLSLRR